MTVLKSPEQIEKMRAAGAVVAAALRMARDELIHPGVSTLEIDERVRDFVVERGGTLLFFNYRGFPRNTCISINEEVVHGIPRKRRKLREGDIVSIDVGVRLAGWCGDSAWTFPVGEVAPETRRLLEVGEESLRRGIEACRDGGRVSDIGRAVQSYVESENYSVVKSFVGHGIGTNLHEDPQVPNYVERGGIMRKDPPLKAGMVLAVEPMVNVGGEAVETLDDGWTVVTKDRKLSVHFEHSIAITEAGPEILTAVPSGVAPELA